MGWDYCRNWHSEADVIRSILLDYDEIKMPIIDHALIGSVFWVLFESDFGNFIDCFLIENNGRKCISAEMHPFYYNCPQRIVDATPTEYAKEWKAARLTNVK